MLRYIVFSLTLFVAAATAKPLDPFQVEQGSISDFVHWVSTQTNENIIIGKGVEGKITFTVGYIDSTDVMSLFKQVMKSNGYTVIKDETFYKVINSPSDRKIIPLDTKIYNFDNISNVKAKVVISSLLSSGSNQLKDPKSDIIFSSHIITLLQNNSLVLSAERKQIDLIDSHLINIDSPVRQVLIEAVIVESSLTKNKELGVNLSTALLDTGFSFISNPLGNLTDLTKLNTGGHMIFRSGGDVRALVNALNKDVDTNILSTPKLFVMDKTQGRISVGQNVPFLKGSSKNDNGDVVQDIERRDVGVVLSVKPIVLGSGKIILNILQESSSVTNSSVASDIITNNRSIQTTAQVSTGQSILLGGLISNETRSTKTGVPFLMDIPLLGLLFSSDTTETVNRELSVMIKTTLL